MIAALMLSLSIQSAPPIPAVASALAFAPQEKINPKRNTSKTAPRSVSPRSSVTNAPSGGGPVSWRNSGYALDASLEVGSGGLNRGGSRGHGSAGSLLTPQYSVGSARPVYRVSNSGEMVYDPAHAFSAVPRYNPTSFGATGFKSFRYGGQY